mgnify:CR=1 FL=1
MAFVIADRVQETCAAPGTGTVSLLGAVTGFQTFLSGIGNNNSTYYCIADQGGANWEVGIGTYSSTGSTLSRDTILSSSNGGSATNFSSGTQSVFCTYPSEKSVNLDSSGNVSALGTISSGTWHGTTIAVGYGGTGGTATAGNYTITVSDANTFTITDINSGSVTAGAACQYVVADAAKDSPYLTTFDTAAVTAGANVLELSFPGEGIVCHVGIYLQLSNMTGVTIFYG